MKNLYDVIRRPLLTEKSPSSRSRSRRSCSSPPRRDQTRNPEGVETLFETKVADIRVARVHGKVKRRAATPAAARTGRRPSSS